MNMAEYSVTKKVTTWLFIILMLGGGATALQDISRLEDPEFTIKEAKVTTLYPGATPQEVEREVTYHIEDAVQQLQQLNRVESISQSGFSEVTVKIKDKYKKADFPSIWDELRRKVGDAQKYLPPGAKQYTFDFDTGKLAVHEHLLTVNIDDGQDHVGTASLHLSTDDNVLPTARLLSIQD